MIVPSVRFGQLIGANLSGFDTIFPAGEDLTGNALVVQIRCMLHELNPWSSKHDQAVCSAQVIFNEDEIPDVFPKILQFDFPLAALVLGF